MAPAVLLVSLKTALFYITETSSLYTTLCLLKLDRMLIEMIASQGLSSGSSSGELSDADKMTLKTLPKDT